MKLKKLVMAGAVAGMLTSGTAMAAGDGDLGVGALPVSSLNGFTIITLTVPNLVRVSALQDITMTYQNPNYVGTSPACVYRNISGDYAVTATSDGASGYLLQNGGSSIAYTVDWAGTPLTDGTKSATFTGGADTTSLSCGGTPNVTLTVTATDAAVAGATVAAAHTDTLGIVVSAE